MNERPRDFRAYSGAPRYGAGGALRRWSINGDFLRLAPNGVVRYARETTRALDRLIGERHPLARGLAIDLIAPSVPDGFALSNIPIRVVPEWKPLRLPQVWCQWQLPRVVPGSLISFCNLAPIAMRRHIVCIHDLQTRLFPESYGLGFRIAHRLELPLIGRRAQTITTVSELSRQQLISHGVAQAEKIVVTYNGADHARDWDPRRAVLRAEFKRSFVLGVGRAQPYKNTQLFWSIAGALDQLGIDIVLAGDIGTDIAARYGPRPSNLHLIGRVSDDDLALLLDRALCFVLPSRTEGFGLPAVEAMIRGCPLVVSTAPCLPEVCSDAALYVDPDEPEAWVSAIGSLASDADLRASLIMRGLKRSEAFTWRRTAETYLQLMAQSDTQSI